MIAALIAEHGRSKNEKPERSACRRGQLNPRSERSRSRRTERGVRSVTIIRRHLGAYASSREAATAHNPIIVAQQRAKRANADRFASYLAIFAFRFLLHLFIEPAPSAFAAQTHSGQRFRCATIKLHEHYQFDFASFAPLLVFARHAAAASVRSRVGSEVRTSSLRSLPSREFFSDNYVTRNQDFN